MPQRSEGINPMAEVKNCLLPDDLYYSVENSLWVRDLENGTAEVGMTDIAQTLAGAMLHCTAKKVGKTVKKGKSIECHTPKKKRN